MEFLTKESLWNIKHADQEKIVSDYIQQHAESFDDVKTWWKSGPFLHRFPQAVREALAWFNFPTEKIEAVFVLADNCDWGEAFKYTTKPDVEPPGNRRTSGDPFEIIDVARIIAKEEGDNDGPNWIGAFELDDGRFAWLSAGCDYTGWG